MTRKNRWKMRKDDIFWLYFLLLLTGVNTADVQTILKKQILQEVTFHFEVPANGVGKLLYLSHQSTNVLYILSNGVEISQPTQSIYTNRTKNAVIISNIFSFTLRALEKTDAGIYTLDSKDPQKLIILGRPNKPTIVSETTFVAFDDAQFNCSAISTSLPNNHDLQMKYIWRRNNLVLSSSNYSLDLFIDKKFQGDNLTCQTYEEPNLTSEVSDSINIQVKFGPEKIEIQPQKSLSVVVYENIKITCFAECRPKCNINWKKNEKILIKNETLNITGVTKSDDGDYTCTASNDYGTSSEGFTLDVQYKPSLRSYSIDNDPVSNITRDEGVYVNISVVIDSNPKPSVLWKKDGQYLSNQENIMLSGPDVNSHHYYGTLSILQTKCKDMGTYHVEVANVYGNKTQDFHVTVLCNPKLDDEEYFKRNFAPSVGEDVVVQMTVLAYPSPYIQNIYHNGSVLSQSHFLKTKTEGDQNYVTVFTLTKFDMEISDLGEYVVEVDNENSDPVNISFYFKTKGPPSPPLNLKAMDLSPHSITLQWMSAFNGGEKQIFSVRYRHTFGNWTVFNQSYNDPGEGLHVTAKITGLRDLTEYVFRVVSKNVYDESGVTSNFSAKTTDITSRPNDLPVTGETAMYIGISVGLFILLVIVVIVAVVMARRKIENKQKDKFFRSLKEAWPMICDSNDNDSYSKVHHEYEEIQVGSPAPTSAPPKPPRTFEEENVAKVNDPIWKPAERKTPKVNENTEHLHNARKLLKPVTNKTVL